MLGATPWRRNGTNAAGLLAGCAGQSSTSNFDLVTIGPGKSAGCFSNPCTILYQMPPGEGSRTVRVNNQVAGAFAADTVANFGAYFRYQSPVRITVDGLDVKEANVMIT
jgi:hypothetical protein